MVVGLIVEEISNVDAKCVKVTGTQNIGKGHEVKVPAESVHLREALKQTDPGTDGQTDRRMEKRAPMSQSQEVREMFHARFDGCFVL